MDTFTINSRFKQYSVAFTEQFGFFKRLASLENAVYVVDENVLRLYPEHFAAIDKERLFPFHAVEEKKNMESVLGFVRVLLRQDVRRNTTLVSIGGGITQDVTGCVASILYRGIPWIFVPTTLLAQVDSCIGSKTSLNLDSYKNVLGAFYPPDEIYVDVGFVDTLSALDRWSGIGELVKLLLMDVSEAADLKRVKREIETLTQNKEGLFAGVKKGLAIKKSYIEEDEFDHGRRNLLNYGHTLGHALEGVSDFRIPHGIGVESGDPSAKSAPRGNGYSRTGFRSGSAPREDEQGQETDRSGACYDIAKSPLCSREGAGCFSKRVYADARRSRNATVSPGVAMTPHANAGHFL